MTSRRLSPGSRLRIIVLGYVVRRPLGGQAWHYLQYVAGLERLGHEIYYLEDSGDWPGCADPDGKPCGWDAAAGLEFLDRLSGRFRFEQRWAYYNAPQDEWHGPLAGRIDRLAADAELLLNISGMNPLRPWCENVPVRVLIDTDPCFTQVRHLNLAEDPVWGSLYGGEQVAKHTAFFSFGENIGKTSCDIPRDGLPWRPTRQPVVLEFWPVTDGRADGRFTTVLQWKPYRAVHYQGKRYGTKTEAVADYLDLPSAVGPVFEMTVSGERTPRDKLLQYGWAVRSGREEVGDPDAYQRYLQHSKAEFSIAKQAYVATRSGWFSERSACYLASGRPVVVEETGFSDWLKASGGVWSFGNRPEAVAAIQAVNNQYPAQCRMARAVAEEYFDSDRVLARLLDQACSGEPEATG